MAAWAASSTDGGHLSVSTAAALVGSQGLQVQISDNTALYVTDTLPNAEARYRARFYFDPNGISMATKNAHLLFAGYTSASKGILEVELRYNNGYQVRTSLMNDLSLWTSTGWVTISDAPHAIEIDWRAATAAGANNGGLTLWIDGAQKANITTADNDSRRIDSVRLGGVSSIDTTTRGTYYIDAFESRRQTYIGQ